jgi:hypothetical protein
MSGTPKHHQPSYFLYLNTNTSQYILDFVTQPEVCTSEYMNSYNGTKAPNFSVKSQPHANSTNEDRKLSPVAYVDA